MGLHPELLPARQWKRWRVHFSFGIIHQGSSVIWRLLPAGTTDFSTILTFKKELIHIYAAVTAALAPSHQSSKEILTRRRAAWMWNQSWCSFGPSQVLLKQGGRLIVLTRISASSPQAAIHLLSYKIQSPQEKEALQALTVRNRSPCSPTFKNFICLKSAHLCRFWGNTSQIPFNIC